MTDRDPAPYDTDHVSAYGERRERDSFVAFIKDNLEAIAVAVIMALVIKHFCVEAFKIPTSSMVPTLRGDHDTPGHPDVKGDRILVDKFAYLFEGPRRWDVIVFRYPLNRSRNFIKRITGMPGERMRISGDGDLWVRPTSDDGGEDDLRIPQKPRRVREQCYRPVYPPPPRTPVDENDDMGLVQGGRRSTPSLDRFWRVEEGPPNAWRLESHDLFVFAGGDRAVLHNASEIRESADPDSWTWSSNSGPTIRDARFRMRVRLPALKQGEAGTLTRLALSWRADGQYQAVLTLSTEAGESEAYMRRGEGKTAQAPLGIVLEPGTILAVELEYVDGMLRAHVGGREVAVLPDGRRFAETWTQSGEQRFRLTAEGGALQVEGLRIDRDLRYKNFWDNNPTGQQRGVDIPADSYFMLGDNTGNSSDSRRWQVVTVYLRGGRTIRYEHKPGGSVEYLPDEDGLGERKQVVDVDGILRTWREDDLDGDKGNGTTEPAPFVHRDLIVGRAFIRFWPCWPEFPGRLGFIH